MLAGVSLEDEQAAGCEPLLRLGKEGRDERQPIILGKECQGWLVRCLAVVALPGGIDVGEVGKNDIIALLRCREEVALNKMNRGSAMLLAIVLSDGEGFKTYVVCINLALWKLELCCDGENAAASTNIGNGALRGLDELQQEGDHLLCLGPRHQHRRRNDEIAPVEFLVPHQVGQWLMPKAAGKELLRLHVLLVQECAIAVGVQPVPRLLQHMAQQELTIEPAAGNTSRP